MNSKKPSTKTTDCLVGRFFHIFGDNREVERQGCVIAKIDPTHYLVQFYDWFVGNPGSMHIFSLDAMTNTSTIINERASGCWQFYESHEHWVEWYTIWGDKKRPHQTDKKAV